MTAKTKNGIGAIVKYTTWLVLLLTVLYSVITDRAEILGSVRVNTEGLADHELRIRSLKTTQDSDIAEIKTDIKWLRRNAEHGKGN